MVACRVVVRYRGAIANLPRRPRMMNVEPAFLASDASQSGAGPLRASSLLPTSGLACSLIHAAIWHAVLALDEASLEYEA